MPFRADMTDPGSTIRRTAICETDGTLTIQSTQDVSEVLAYNTALRNAERRSTSLWNGSGWVLVAQVPLLWLEKLRRQGLDYNDKNDWPRIVSMLNSNDYSRLRTAPGVI